MSIVLISDRDPNAWRQAIQNHSPKIDLRIHPEAGNKEEVEYALVWNHPPGALNEYPNLKVVSSMGAGVDHILRDPQLPEGIKITRIVDEQLAIDMAEFVLALVMGHLRNFPLHKEKERQAEWKPKSYLRIADVKVGIMGMGNLGTTVAKKLADTGFQVHGWARSRKEISNIQMFTGEDEMESFLSQSRILICLLPLTPKTENILDKQLFEKLPQDAFLINVARGKHLVEEDLLTMLDRNHLSGAALDVFRTEPLPENHPFWKHPKIQVTPHIASVTKPTAVVPQVLENYRRMKNEEELLHVVEREKGY